MVDIQENLLISRVYRKTCIVSMDLQENIQEKLYKTAVFNTQDFCTCFLAWTPGRGWGILVRLGGPGDMFDCRKNKKD